LLASASPDAGSRHAWLYAVLAVLLVAGAAAVVWLVRH
jgi:hypothetical protein